MPLPSSRGDGDGDGGRTCQDDLLRVPPRTTRSRVPTRIRGGTVRIPPIHAVDGREGGTCVSDVMAASDVLSRRMRDTAKPPPRYLAAFLGALTAEEAAQRHGTAENDASRPWSKENRNGLLLLAVAENRLEASLWIAKRIHEAKQPPPESLRYGDMRGCLRLREAAGRRLFPKAARADASVVTACNGCGSAVEMLAFSLCDPGDVAIIPAPYYPSFDSDLSTRAQVQPVAARGNRPEALEEAARQVEKDGKRARMLLLTQPHNPCGDAMELKRMKEAIKWAMGRNMHVVSDEIYLCSVYNGLVENVCTSADAVESLVQECPDLAQACNERVHSIMGLSKDFAASGMRVGFIHSRNMDLNNVLGGLGYFHAIPGDLQHRVAEMLEDEEFLDRFEEENRRLLKTAYDKVSSALQRVGASCVFPVGGLFVWADFRSFLDEATWEAEDRLYDRLLKEEGILLSPGRDMHALEPGFFRICFAWAGMEALDDFESRLTHFVGRLTGRV